MPIQKFITSAFGGIAPLMTDGDDPEDRRTGFSIDAVLGTLVLTTTGNMADLAGESCSFRLENVPLFGERNGD